MTEHITASPLTWPEGWARCKNITSSRFGSWNKPISIAKATLFILHELELMGILQPEVIISTDLRLRHNGLPYSKQRDPEDKGVSVWWTDCGSRRVIALDQYDRIADNLWAIGKTIEAMRGIERWGGGEILERTFTGFVALPDQSKNWRAILGNASSIAETTNLFKLKRAEAHPDKGGSSERFNEVCQAYEQAKEEFAAYDRNQCGRA